MQLTGSYGQVLKPDWMRQGVSIESMWANLQGLQRLEMSRATAQRISGGNVPRCGYEITLKEQTLHEHHIKRLYLTNVSNAVYYFRVYKGKMVEVQAETSYQAQQKAAAILKAKKTYEVTVVLCEKSGQQVTHCTSEV